MKITKWNAALSFAVLVDLAMKNGIVQFEIAEYKFLLNDKVQNQCP